MNKYTVTNILISILLTYFYVYFLNVSVDKLWFAVVCMAIFVLIMFVLLLARQKNLALKQFYKDNTTLIYYNRMQLMATISLYCNVWLFFMQYFANQTTADFWLALLIIAGTTLLVLILSIIWSKCTRKRWMKTSLFVLGSIFCACAFFFIEIKFFGLNILYYILYCCGISMLLSAMCMLANDVDQALMLLDDRKYSLRVGYSIVSLKAQIITNIVFFALYLIFVQWLDNAMWVSVGMNILSAVCVLLGLIYSLALPIDKIYAHKLQQYYDNDDTVNIELLEKQLRDKLSKGHNSVYLSILKFFVKPFFKAKVYGKSNVDTSKGAVVFIANHYEIYGPIVTILRLPFNVRPWIISSMLDEKVVVEQLQEGVNNVCHLLPKKLRKKVPSIIKPLLLNVLNGLDPIPVYRGSTRQVLTTLKLTVEALQQGDNILLFPENPEEKYAQQGVDQFFTGFAEIGSRYYRATGKSVTFYPVYIDKYNKEICIGTGISYDGQADPKVQKHLIATTLNQRMTEMSQLQAQKYEQKKNKKRKKANSKNIVKNEHAVKTDDTEKTDKDNTNNDTKE